MDDDTKFTINDQAFVRGLLRASHAIIRAILNHADLDGEDVRINTEDGTVTASDVLDAIQSQILQQKAVN